MVAAEKGIYAYETKQGTRYYFKYRTSDGKSATKRGFTSPRAARRAREQTMVAASRGEIMSSRDTFGEYFERWLAERKPYLEPGTYADYRNHGAKRLTALHDTRLTKLSTGHVKTWLAELVEDEVYATKTINNSLVESSWGAWRLLALGMQGRSSCRQSAQLGSRRPGGIRLRRRQRRCGWSARCRPRRG